MVFSFGGELIIVFDDGEDGTENKSRHPHWHQFLFPLCVQFYSILSQFQNFVPTSLRLLLYICCICRIRRPGVAFRAGTGNRGFCPGGFRGLRSRCLAFPSAPTNDTLFPFIPFSFLALSDGVGFWGNVRRNPTGVLFAQIRVACRHITGTAELPVSARG